MKNILRHREYVGSVEIDEHEGFLYGRVLGIQEKITYRAERADELVRLFRAEIDAYLTAAHGKTLRQRFRTRAASMSALPRHCTAGLRSMRSQQGRVSTA